MSEIIDLEKFISAELKKKPISDMAKDFNITEEQVINYRKALGLPPRIEKGGIVDLLTFKKLKNSGKNNQQIADFFGVEVFIIEKLQNQLDTLACVKFADIKFERETIKSTVGTNMSPHQIKNMKKRKKPSDFDINTFIEMATKGMSNSDIADHFGMNYQNVSKKKRELGLSRGRIHYDEPTEDEIKKIRELKAEGKTDVEISKIIGLPASKIVKIRKDNNIEVSTYKARVRSVIGGGAGNSFRYR